MAQSIAADIKTVGMGTRVISGSFVNNGTTLTGARGKGWTAVRTSAGLITVTLGQNYNSLICGDAQVNPASPPAKWAAQVSQDLTTYNTFTITTYDGSSGSPSAADSGSTDRVSFMVVLSTSSVNK